MESEFSAKPWEYPLIAQKTRGALARELPIFEGGFLYDGAFARFDILNPAGRGAWDLIEVKSSTEVKEVNLDDLAVQYYIAIDSGLSIHSYFLHHTDSLYLHRGGDIP